MRLYIFSAHTATRIYVRKYVCLKIAAMSEHLCKPLTLGRKSVISAVHKLLQRDKIDKSENIYIHMHLLKQQQRQQLPANSKTTHSSLKYMDSLAINSPITGRSRAANIILIGGVANDRN